MFYKVKITFDRKVPQSVSDYIVTNVEKVHEWLDGYLKVTDNTRIPSKKIEEALVGNILLLPSYPITMNTYEDKNEIIIFVHIILTKNNINQVNRIKSITSVVLDKIKEIYSDILILTKTNSNASISNIEIGATTPSEIASHMNLNKDNNFKLINYRFYLKRYAVASNEDSIMSIDDIYKIIPTYMSFTDKIASNNSDVSEGIALNGNKYREFYYDNKFNRGVVYKLLARSKNHIPEVVDPIIMNMYNLDKIPTREYCILDFNTIYSHENVSFDKLTNIFNRLYFGSSIVIWIDIPNIIYDEVEPNEEPNSQVYHKFDARFDDDKEEDDDFRGGLTTDSDKKAKEKLFKRKLDRYARLLDQYNILRKVVSNDRIVTDLGFAKQEIATLTSMKEYTLDNIPFIISTLIRFIMDTYKYTNIFLCYSDSIAASKNEYFDFIIPRLDKEGSGIVNLIDDEIFKDSDNVMRFIKNTNKLYLNNFCSYEVVKSVHEKIMRRINSDIGDKSDFHYLTSVPSFTYFVCKMLEDEYKDNSSSIEKEFDKEMSDSIKKALEQKKKEKKTKKSDRDIMDQTFTYEEDAEEDYRDDEIYFDDTNSTKYKKKSDGNGTDVKSLDEMIGLTEVKQQIKDFTAFMRLNELKRKRELETIVPSRHMIFTGNPGTAKTTVAILLAHILYENHTIARDNVDIVSRDQLVAKYVGHTAIKVREAIEKAQGGILFVDEAYSLVDGVGANSFGQEAIDTFVNYMDNKKVRETTIIIFAGYKKEMLEFCESNPGIRSRVGFIIDFPDYSTEELMEISNLQAKNQGIVLSDDFKVELEKAINQYKKEKSFGNGRFVRSVLEKSMMKQARRLCDKYGDDLSSITDEEIVTLTKDDFSLFGLKKPSDKKIGF